MNEGLVINEPFQVAAIIGMLPYFWKEFKNYLKHKNKEITLEKLVVRLRIEENNRVSDKGSQIGYSKTHMVESKSTENKGKKRKFNVSEKSTYKGRDDKRFKGACFNCGKPGHRKAECRKPKQKGQLNIV